MTKAREVVILALDGMNLEQAERAMSETVGLVHAYKVGFELFVREGPRAVHVVTRRGERVFLDLKFKDIPNTVRNAARAAVEELGVWMFNVHADNPRASLQAAAEVKGSALAVAVTVLTAFDVAEYLQRFGRTLTGSVSRFTEESLQCGLDGVVSSPHELDLIRLLSPNCLTVVPGVRPAFASQDDQERVMTPAEAIKAGANYLVIGRPITKHPDGMVRALNLINEELASV